MLDIFSLVGVLAFESMSLEIGNVSSVCTLDGRAATRPRLPRPSELPAGSGAALFAYLLAGMKLPSSNLL